MTAVWEFIKRHDVTLDLIVVWALCLGAFTMGTAKMIAWWTIRTTRDATAIGASLKKQKLSEGVFWYALSLLYAMTLAAFYWSHQFGLPERTALRVVLMVAIVVSIYYVARFIYYLRRDRE